MAETPQTTFPTAKVRELTLLALAIGIAFLTINYLHFRLLEVSVILYACILDAAAALLVVLVPYAWLRLPRAPVLRSEVTLTSIAAALLILLYSVMGPTVIDRSLSIYIVEKIKHRGGAVAEAAMPKIILTEFMNEYHVAEVRMTEQVASHTVEIKDGCIRLTPRGRRIAAITQFFRENFLPVHRRVGNAVTSDLTRPYEDTPVLVPYACPSAGAPAP